MKTIRKYSKYFSEGGFIWLWSLCLVLFLGAIATKLFSYNMDPVEHYSYLLHEEVYKYLSTMIILGTALLYMAIKTPSSLIVLLTHDDTKKGIRTKKRAVRKMILAPLFCAPIVFGLVGAGALDKAEASRAKWHLETAIDIAEKYADEGSPFTFTLAPNPYTEDDAVIELNSSGGLYKMDGVAFENCMMFATEFSSVEIEGYTLDEREPELSCKIFNKVKVNVLL